MLWTRIALTVMALTSSLISFLAYTVFLRSLGASASVDMLFFAACAPISMAAIVAGVLGYILPANLTRLTRRNQDGAINLLLLICFAVTAVAVLATLVGLLAGDRPTFWLLLLGFTVTGGLQVNSALQVCLAQARGRFLQTTLAPLITSAGLFIGVLVALWTRQSWCLLAGQLGGTIAAVGLLSVMLDMKIRINVRRDRLVGLAAFAPMKPHGLAIAMGTTAFTLFQPIDAILCSRLGSGSMAIMSYAQRILVSLGTAISLGAYAIAARRSHETLRFGGHNALRQQAHREVARIIAFGLLAWLAYEIGGIRVLAFLLSSSNMSPGDVARLLGVLGWMVLGVGPMAVMPYLFRVYFALRDYRTPGILGISVAPCYGVLAWLLSERYQVTALAIAYSTVWWIVLIPAVLCLKRVPEGFNPGLART